MDDKEAHAKKRMKDAQKSEKTGRDQKEEKNLSIIQINTQKFPFIN